MVPPDSCTHEDLIWVVCFFPWYETGVIGGRRCSGNIEFRVRSGLRCPATRFREGTCLGETKRSAPLLRSFWMVAVMTSMLFWIKRWEHSCSHCGRMQSWKFQWFPGFRLDSCGECLFTVVLEMRNANHLDILCVWNRFFQSVNLDFRCRKCVWVNLQLCSQNWVSFYFVVNHFPKQFWWMINLF